MFRYEAVFMQPLEIIYILITPSKLERYQLRLHLQLSGEIKKRYNNLRTRLKKRSVERLKTYISIRTKL